MLSFIHKKKYIKFYFFILFLIYQPTVFSQIDCSHILRNAIEKYHEGLYEDIVNVLPKIFDKCDFSENERNDALKILISSYMQLDEIESGHEYMYYFLKENPNYKINLTSDPVPFVEAINNFNIKPMFEFGVGLSLIRSNAQILKNYTLWDVADYSKSYNYKFKPEYGFNFQWNITNKLSLQLSAFRSEIYYSREITAYTNLVMNYSETTEFFKFPIGFSYKQPIYKNWSLIGSLGVYSSLINKASSEFEINDVRVDPSNNETLFNKKESLSDINDSRISNNFGYYWGFGIKYKIKKFNILFNISKLYDTKNYNLPSKRYDNILAKDYYYVDDDIIFSYFILSLGVTYNLFHKVTYKYD